MSFTVDRSRTDTNSVRNMRTDGGFEKAITLPTASDVQIAQRKEEIIALDGGVLLGSKAVVWAIAFAIGGTGILSNQRKRDAAMKEAESILRQGGRRLQEEVQSTINSVRNTGMRDAAMIAVVADKVKHVIVPFRTGSNDRVPPSDNTGGGSRRPTCSMTVNVFPNPSAPGNPGGRVIYNATVNAHGNGTLFVPKEVTFTNMVTDPKTVPPNHTIYRNENGSSLTIAPGDHKMPTENPVYYTPSPVSTMRAAGICVFIAPDGKVLNEAARPTVSINGANQPSSLTSGGDVVIRIKLK